MQKHIITYDLYKDKNYEKLFDAIKKLGRNCRPLLSLWVVESNKQNDEIREYLKDYIDKDDKLLVANLDYWATNFKNACTDFMKAK